MVHLLNNYKAEKYLHGSNCLTNTDFFGDPIIFSLQLTDTIWFFDLGRIVQNVQ